MPATPEHKADMFQLARSRIAAGKKSWEHTVNVSGVFHDDKLTFEERRDAIVRTIRASGWVRDADEFGRLVEVVDGLAVADDATEFDGWFDELYDLADYDRVWIKTRF